MKRLDVNFNKKHLFSLKNRLLRKDLPRTYTAETKIKWQQKEHSLKRYMWINELMILWFRKVYILRMIIYMKKSGKSIVILSATVQWTMNQKLGLHFCTSSQFIIYIFIQSFTRSVMNNRRTTVVFPNLG